MTPTDPVVRMDLGMADVHAPADGTSKPVRRKKRKAKPKGLSMTIDHPKHGKIEVRHMRAVELDSSTALADTADQKVWIQLAKVGDFSGHPAGPFKLDAKVFGDIVRNFHSTHNKRVPIDFEHASEQDSTSGSIPTHGAPAQGWILDLDNRLQGGLWGLVEWGQRAREYIKEGSYRYISPAIRFNSKDRVTGKQIGARLTSAGLTNSPFLDAMAPMAASDRADDSEEEDDGEEDDTATLDDVVEAIRALHEKHDPAPAEKDPVGDKEPIMADSISLKDLESKNAELSLKLSERDAALSTLKAENAQLLAWKEEQEEKAVQEEVEIAFETYKDVHKFGAEQKAFMLTMCKSSPDAFRGMYPRVKPSEMHLQRNLTSRRDNTPLSDGAPALSINRLTKKLMSEKHLPYAKAQSEAAKILLREGR